MKCCPVCGSAAEAHENASHFRFVQCTECRVKTVPCADPDSALKDWDERVHQMVRIEAVDPEYREECYRWFSAVHRSFMARLEKRKPLKICKTTYNGGVERKPGTLLQLNEDGEVIESST